MSTPNRRIVTGHDTAGKAIILMDGAAPNVKHRQSSGITSNVLWVEDATPSDNSGDEDKGNRDIGVAPPDGGSVFRVVEFPPEGEGGATFSNEAMKAEMGLDPAASGGPARHPSMHRTRSIDYAIVISGEIDMLMDDTEVHMGPGDLVVQRGTNHAWVNRGTEPCRIAFVLIDAKPL